ncbi:DUF1269 domain-containing protein [Janthinobacterium sp. 17J80-10]|uniref:DUF1269 domain-containing protein n=1 Tax=Janthinobacterium sp. 17J80-10 TaxID=2497863 RepID=UPI0010058C40|nr:DUF1269 domain-containing protein [Janthinobacterium sp. 17J80-10]QAU34048.1 DUF1269 domain-containing protein [Janthinobacterium sp. 17J80-10]
MSELISVAYRDACKAAEVLNAMQRLQNEYLIDLEDAAYVTKDREGRIRLHQSVNIPVIGAVSGTFWGALIGMIFLNPLLGAAIGAGSGALTGAIADYGINDEFMKNLAAELRPDSSALFILARRYTPDKVIHELSQFGGTLLRTSLTAQAEATLQDALDGKPLPYADAQTGGPAPQPGNAQSTPP